MGVERGAVRRGDHLNLIFLEASRGAQMEIFGVFIPQGTVPNFCSLPPVRGVSGDQRLKSFPDKIAKVELRGLGA